MNTIKNTVKHSVIGGITFLLTVGTGLVVYGALINLPAKVSPGTGLTANSWNMMVDSLTELDSKINSSSIPSGAILMFNNGCPDTTNWTRVTALDNKFPRGATTYGTTGGADTHTHAAGTLLGPLHNHMWWNYIGTTAIDQTYNSVGTSINVSPVSKTAYYSLIIGGSSYSLNTDAYTNKTGNTAVTGNTASSSNVPSYVTVVYCSKN